MMLWILFCRYPPGTDILFPFFPPCCLLIGILIGILTGILTGAPTTFSEQPQTAMNKKPLGKPQEGRPRTSMDGLGRVPPSSYLFPPQAAQSLARARLRPHRLSRCSLSHAISSTVWYSIPAGVTSSHSWGRGNLPTLQEHNRAGSPINHSMAARATVGVGTPKTSIVCRVVSAVVKNLH
jgi:hypothetical protein